MSNVFSSNPIYIDTDTTVAGNTNWRGSSGGSASTGKIGIRPIQLIITALGATTAGLVTINEITSGGSTGVVLFKVEIPTATATASQAYQFTTQLSGVGWHDFIVTGVTATGTAIEIYYKV